jgi:TIR domain
MAAQFAAAIAGVAMPELDGPVGAALPVDDSKRVADLSARWAVDQIRDKASAAAPAHETPVKAPIGPGDANRKFAAASKRLDNVECSVFAPANPRRASRILIQALLHKTEQLAQAIEMAHQLTPDANRKGFAKLKTRIRRGAEVSLFLDMPVFEIAKPLVKVVWHGEAVRAVYSAVIPAETPLGAANGTLHVMIDGAPVGEIAFQLRVGEAVAARPSVQGQTPVYTAFGDGSIDVESDPGAAVGPVATDAKAFTRAFVSYSRKDFDDVSRYVEILEDCGIHTLFDLTSLEPGVEWEQELPRMIEAADVFYLMWSDNAAQSPVVDMEARQAVSLHDAHPERVPRVRPVLLRTPSPLPHDYLKRFNFSADWALRRAGYKAGVIFAPSEPAKT